MTIYRSSSNLSYARARSLIQGAQNIGKSNKTEINLDQFFDSEVIIVQTGVQVRQKPRSSMQAGELIPSLEKFGFPNLTCHNSKARKHKKNSEYLQYPDLRHWTVGGG